MATVRIFKTLFTLMTCYVLLGSYSAASMQSFPSIKLSDYETITPNNIKQLRQLAAWDAEDAAFAPNGINLALANGRLIKLIDLNAVDAPSIILQTELKDGRLNFNNDGTRLIYQNYAGQFDLWETTTGTKLPIRDVKTISAFSPTLSHFATTENDRLTIYDLNGTKQQTLKLDGEITKLRFSPDDLQLAILYPHALKLWNLQNNSEVLSYTVPSDEMSDVLFSPDGNQLAAMWYGLTADYSKYTTKIQFWDTSSLQPAELFIGDGMQYSLKLSPQGNVISASGSGNNLTDIVRLWDKASQKIIRTLSALSGGGIIAFSPNEDLIAVGSGTTPNVELMPLYDNQAVSPISLKNGIGTIKEQFNSGGQLLLITGVQQPNRTTASLWGIPKNGA